MDTRPIFLDRELTVKQKGQKRKQYSDTKDLTHHKETKNRKLAKKQAKIEDLNNERAYRRETAKRLEQLQDELEKLEEKKDGFFGQKKSSKIKRQIDELDIQIDEIKYEIKLLV